jgi:hypothetical protein
MDTVAGIGLFLFIAVGTILMASMAFRSNTPMGRTLGVVVLLVGAFVVAGALATWID